MGSYRQQKYGLQRIKTRKTKFFCTTIVENPLPQKEFKRCYFIYFSIFAAVKRTQQKQPTIRPIHYVPNL